MEAALTHLQPPQAGSRCYCIQATVPRDSHGACLQHSCLQRRLHEKAQGVLSNWSGKLSACQLIHEDVTPSGLKGPGAKGWGIHRDGPL